MKFSSISLLTILSCRSSSVRSHRLVLDYFICSNMKISDHFIALVVGLLAVCATACNAALAPSCEAGLEGECVPFASSVPVVGTTVYVCCPAMWSLLKSPWHSNRPSVHTVLILSEAVSPLMFPWRQHLPKILWRSWNQGGPCILLACFVMLSVK